MPVSSQMLGVRGDECNCGRRSTVRHCPACGSFRVYGRTGRMHKHLNGEVKLVETEFRCQACTHLFIDTEREFCEAPAVGQKLATQRVRALAEARAAGEYLKPAERKAADAIAKALREGKPFEEASKTLIEMSSDDYTRLLWDLKRVWSDKAIEFRTGKSMEDPLDMNDFVKTEMEKLGVKYIPEKE